MYHHKIPLDPHLIGLKMYNIINIDRHRTAAATIDGTLLKYN